MFSVIGAVLIVCGLYMVLWGKSKEIKTSSEETENVEASAGVEITTVGRDNIQ